MTNRVTAAESAATALTTTVSGHTTSIDTHATQISDLQAADTAITTEAATLAATVGGHTGTLATHSAEIENLQAAEAKITGAAATVTSRVTAAEIAATALTTTVGGHTTAIGTHTGQIGNLRTADTAITEAAATLTNCVTAAEGAAATLSTWVGSAETAATDLALRVTKAETLMVSSSPLVTALLGLQSADTTITNSIGTLTTRVTAAERLTGDTALAATVGTLQAYAPCCGRTAPGSTAWIYYSEGIGGVEVDVDISSCGFAAGSTPLITTSIGGTSTHWTTTGGTSIYKAKSGLPLNQAFRVHLFPFTFSTTDIVTPLMTQILTLATINNNQWHINWCARRV